MSVAIDYTASNGDPSDPSSLHYNDPDRTKKNQYEIAMEQVGKVLETYAYKKKFMAYGYGGKVNGQEQVSHCFELNGNQKDPAIDGLQNLLDKYKESLSKVKLWGPTIFKEFLERVKKFVKEKMETPVLLYHVLLILTDGCIHDMRETINCIVQMSDLPISIIIVGIGKDKDFGNMEILDADNVVLTNDNQEESKRDIVQFVKYDDYGENIGRLAEQVLCEVPDQMVLYMIDKGKKPEPVKVHTHEEGHKHGKSKKKQD